MVRSAASLRIFSQQDLSSILPLIDRKPERHRKVGDLKSPRNPVSAKFDYNLLAYSSTAKPEEPLEVHLAEILNIIDRSTGLKDAIDSLAGEWDIFCMLASEDGQGSAVIHPTLSRRLADHEIEVILDFYPP